MAFESRNHSSGGRQNILSQVLVPMGPFEALGARMDQGKMSKPEHTLGPKAFMWLFNTQNLSSILQDIAQKNLVPLGLLTWALGAQGPWIYTLLKAVSMSFKEQVPCESNWNILQNWWKHEVWFVMLQFSGVKKGLEKMARGPWFRHIRKCFRCASDIYKMTKNLNFDIFRALLVLKMINEARKPGFWLIWAYFGVKNGPHI